MLDLAVEYDRLNVRNLVCIEWVCRRLMLQESAISENPDAPSFEGARHFLGYGERKGGALVAPGLASHVASEMSKEASIMKEKRKAREAKNFHPNKGRGKGQQVPAPAGNP